MAGGTMRAAWRLDRPPVSRSLIDRGERKV